MYKCEVTNENFISSNTTTDVNNNPFVKYFGEFLYKWNENKDEITIQKTEDLLKNKNTVAIYYSASWYFIHIYEHFLIYDNIYSLYFIFEVWSL